ncbi:MAG: antirestriction protein ArdA [Eubacteriales bacterium]
MIEQARFRSYTIGNLNGIDQVTVKFPCSEEVIQKTCDEIHVENLASANIRILEVDDSALNQSVEGLKMTLDELNYLEKRFDSFTSEEMDLFCAVAEVSSPKDGFDLINLSYNLHCYSLVDSSKNMEEMGRELYLHEAISCPTEELQQVNGQKYLAELMKNNTPWETSQGLLYPNKNEPTQVYNGKNLPPFSYGGTAVEVVLTCEHPTMGTCEELLALPYYGSDLAKIKERMGVESLKDIKVDNIIILTNPQDNFLSSMDLEEVYTADDLDNLSDVAEFYDLGTKEMCDDLNHFAVQLKVDNLHQLSLVALGILTEELEFVPNITTAEDYGYYLVCENDETKIDEDIASFVDYDGYGASQLVGKSYVSTDEGMMIYHGDEVGMEQMLEQFEQEQEQSGMTTFS